MVSDFAVAQCGQVITDTRIIFLPKGMQPIQRLRSDSHAPYHIVEGRLLDLNRLQFVAGRAGYPALVLAAAIESIVAALSSNTTTAVLVS